MIRKIIKINSEKCNGCGLCVEACHESAIGLVNGKAQLLRDDYCDGLGNCLPVCPTNAITFEEREAADYDEAAVQKNIEKKQKEQPMACGCPGTNVKILSGKEQTEMTEKAQSQLRQWPVQIKLVPVNAPYFEQSHLLIAADCTAYAYGNFHNQFMKNKVVLVGCPKLDDTDYAQKLMEILKNNDVKSITIVRMEVPCCSGMEHAVKRALVSSGKMIPWHIHVIGLDGEIKEEY